MAVPCGERQRTDRADNRASLGGKPDIGGMHSIGAPIQVYPLYENAFRAHRGQTPRANNDESATLYAGFAKVAAQHPHAWNYGRPPATKEEIQSVSRRNRMICSPCESTTQRYVEIHLGKRPSLRRAVPWADLGGGLDPLLMNAFNTVNLAAACILTSVEKARQLGVPEEKWVYPLGGAGRKERERCASFNPQTTCHVTSRRLLTLKTQSGSGPTSTTARPYLWRWTSA